MQREIRVLLVDDNAQLRTLWERLIDEQPDMALADSLQSADQLAARITHDDDLVVLLDLVMPGGCPLAVMADLQRTCTRCRVIVYTGHTDSQSVRESIANGAWGLVDKLSPPEVILDVIRRVADGEVVFPFGLAASGVHE